MSTAWTRGQRPATSDELYWRRKRLEQPPAPLAATDDIVHAPPPEPERPAPTFYAKREQGRGTVKAFHGDGIKPPRLAAAAYEADTERRLSEAWQGVELGSPPKCPKNHGFMARKASRSIPPRPFWGCSEWPKCDETQRAGQRLPTAHRKPQKKRRWR